MFNHVFLSLMSEDDSIVLAPQALTGQHSPQTLRFQETLHNLHIIVLIDIGSCHNILQPRLAHHLNLL